MSKSRTATVAIFGNTIPSYRPHITLTKSMWFALTSLPQVGHKPIQSHSAISFYSFILFALTFTTDVTHGQINPEMQTAVILCSLAFPSLKPRIWTHTRSPEFRGSNDEASHPPMSSASEATPVTWRQLRWRRHSAVWRSAVRAGRVVSARSGRLVNIIFSAPSPCHLLQTVCAIAMVGRRVGVL